MNKNIFIPKITNDVISFPDPPDPENLNDVLRRHLLGPGRPIDVKTHGDAVAGTLIALATQGGNEVIKLNAIREIFDRIQYKPDSDSVPCYSRFVNDIGRLEPCSTLPTPVDTIHDVDKIS